MPCDVTDGLPAITGEDVTRVISIGDTGDAVDLQRLEAVAQ